MELWYLTSEVQFCHLWLIVKCSNRVVGNWMWLFFIYQTIANTDQKRERRFYSLSLHEKTDFSTDIKDVTVRCWADVPNELQSYNDLHHFYLFV